MSRRWMVWLAAGCLALRAQETGPSYSAAGIVESASFTPGALAPWSLATIFGDRLAFSSASSGGAVREELADVRVFVNNIAAQLLYVSPGQINLLVPYALIPGAATIRVTRQGRAGPDVALTLSETAPALFRTPAGFAIAAHADAAVVTEEAPARAGEIVVLYAVGLGRTKISPPPGVANEIVRAADLRVLLDGAAVPQALVKYAGIAPAWPGLYQINVEIPADAPRDPELRIAIGDRSSAPGIRLPVR